MKKIVLIIVIIVIICCGVGFIIFNNKTSLSNNEFEKSMYNKYVSDIDGGVGALRNSEEFKSMNKDEQIKSMGRLLDLYESSGIIKNVYYDKDSEMYTFQYSNGEIDGALGGVMLKEFNPMLN